MHVLIVIDHPNPASLSHAIAHAFAQGAEAAGHTTELADLHGEGFHPVWSMADITQYETEITPPDVLREQARIERSDAICLVFPLFWFGMPAIMKGWIDRVFTQGWAYAEGNDPDSTLLKPRIGVMLIPAGGNPETWQSRDLDAAMRAIWTGGTLSYFGMTEPRIHFLAGSHGSEARRASLLAEARYAGRKL